MNHGSELAGTELLQQLMGMLYVSGHCVLDASRAVSLRLLPCGRAISPRNPMLP
jgi:hypothetical protein